MGVLDSDPRRAYVLNTVVDAIATGEQKSSLLDHLAQENSPAIAAFLDDASVNLLQASVSGIVTGSPQVTFSNSAEFPSGCEYQLLLAKLAAGPLRAADIPTNVVVSSVAQSPLASLYHSLRTVYGPMLGNQPSTAKGLANGTSQIVSSIAGNPKLQELLAQLEAGLGSALRGSGRSSANSVAAGQEGPDKASLLGVLRPEDEFQMWAELAGGGASVTLQRRATEISGHFEPIWSPFVEVGKGAGMSEEAVLELLENTQEVLEAVWAVKSSDSGDGWAYPQRRMAHLMTLVGAALMGYVQSSLKGINLWNADFKEVEAKLRAGLRIVGRWEHVTHELASMLWASSEPGRHGWAGKYSDSVLAAFRERLDECLKMREANEELRKLLTPEEANSLNVDHVFQPFALVNALHISEYVAPLWAAAKEEYGRRMQPIEDRLSQKLKELFGSVLIPSLTAAVSKHGERGGLVAQPHQVFREFKRYGGLLSRPLISERLQIEKDTLAKQVDIHLENILQDFQSREDRAARNIKNGSASNAGRNLPVVVDHIVWSLQAQTKVEETQQALEYLTGAEEGNSSALGQCLVLCSDLRKDISEFKRNQYNDWSEEVMDRLEEIKLEKTGKLMDFHVADGHVNLHFNDDLVSLLREVRALQALGFSIPSAIQAEVATANKFYRQGMVLKQVGNFYNDIATQMIPCQKPMMLEDARKFEDVLTNPRDGLGKPLTWANATALDNYVARLQEVASRLTEKNRKLRKWHKVLGDKVATLMGTDLVRNRDRWVAGVKDIRAIFSNLENEGFSRASQANWRLHWDYQLYKALEYQYVRGLECLNEALPQMEVKMVFKQRKLQYDPPLEELRTTHNKQHTKAFIGLPMNLKGVSDASERPGFFRHMVDGASRGIAKVYTSTEILFAKLQEELKRLQDWVALGTVDLDSFVDERLEEVSDWELNFKYLKLAAKEAEKVPAEVKIDCYTVNLLPVKTAIEEHMKHLQEALITSLRRKTAAEKAEVEDFVKNGKDALEQQFTSVEEIGAARQNAKEMIGRVSHVLNLRRKIEDKNKLIRQMATAIGPSSGLTGGGGAAMAGVDMSELNNEWETFQTKLQQHETHLEDQKNQLKGQIERNITDFKSKVNGFASRWQQFKPKGAPEGDPQLMLAKIEDDALSLAELLEEAKKMNQDCEHFQMDLPDFTTLEDIAADVEATKVAWSRYGEFLKDRDELANRDWISMRDEVWRIEDFLAKWQETGKTAGKIASSDPVAMILMKEIDAYRRAIPNLKYVRGNGWEKKHWNKLFDMIQLPTKGPNAVTPENLTLAHFLDKADNLAKASEDIKELDSQAQGESVLRKALDELNAWGYDRRFNLVEHVSTAGGGSRRTVLIKEWKDILTEVGDHQSLVGSLKQSKYYQNFKDETTAWETRLASLQDGLASLNQIQRKWVYLEPIFARGALPQQQARFRRVDDEFRGLMATVESNTLVTHFADVPRLNDMLPQMVSQLEICQKALADFLEEKRQMFPRFYFIGDDDLLEILGQSKNPEVIQTHLKKLFAGIHSVVFTEDFGTIKAMQSIEKEVVPLGTVVEVTDGVEVWLNELAKSMKATLQGTLPGCMRAKDFKTHPSQILNLEEMCTFTAKAESAIQRNNLPALQKELRGQLQEYTSADYTGYRVMQLKIQALVLDLIHNIEIVDQLLEAQCKNLEDWAWSKQLRYYSNESGAVRVKMAGGDFEYTYEYQGNAPKLVYTPLTDKCYLTLTQGMALGYGGNPYGPAGTGKTESVKALGQAMARQVLVFNCDEQFDFKSMGRIFVGLVKCGAWGCFDEFNRLDEEVLSAVSQQIQQIQGAIKEHTASIEFMGQQVKVDFNAGIFVTLNPAGKGYGGRSKLPDNLKQLFRSVAMSVPNNELIAEVMLLSEGIKAARDIGRKTVSLFNLSKQLLSPQQHYDWGLRALKTVLGIAGRLLQERRAASGGALSPEEETDLVLQAVKVTTLPKLTYGDNKRFLSLLADVFPGAAHSNTNDPAVEDAIRKAMEEMQLEPLPAQVEKVLQLHLACVQRIGIIIVGPSGAGKSTLWRILEAAYRHMSRPVKTHIMNPKAMHRQRLLGHMDMDTREMFDGVLTAASRQVVKEPLEQHSWIICDGDVDPEWIESLNSVLDDNRLLTLPSGERIQFASNINFIFECHSLEFASPATVSRCGMLYLSEENIDVDRILSAWIKRQPDAQQANLTTWIDEYFLKALEWAEGQPQAVESSKLGMVNSCLSQVRNSGTKHEFCVGLAKGLGANMEPKVREELLTFLARLTSEGDLLATPPGASIQSIVRGEDDDGVGVLSTGKLIVTRDTLINASLIAAWLRRGEPLLLVGPEGCGKSVLLEQCFSELRGTTTATVNCSAQTTAENAIQKLSQMCGKPVSTNTGRVLRPRDSDRLILYLKDINLPRPDKYKTIQLISFLQQIITYNGFYDEHLEFIGLERIQVVASMNPTSTVGRHPISTRFTAIARCAYMTYPDRDQLVQVYSQMLHTALVEAAENNPMWSNEASCTKLANTMLDIYDGVKRSFRPDDYRHYQFTPRNLTEWVQGLQRLAMGVEVLDGFAYEASRIFRDRLVGEEAISTYDGIVRQAMAVQWQWSGPSGGEATLLSTLGASVEERLDSKSPPPALAQWKLEDFAELAAGKLKQFERESKDLGLLLFPEVLQRIAALDRVLSLPGGSVLLCGRAGVGRRSATSLVSYIHHMDMFSPCLTRNYDVKAFRNDLKNVMIKTGGENTPMLLFLEDHHISDSTFLEYVNSLLSGGEVPGLFSNEELEGILAPLRDALASEGFQYSSPFEFFTARVRRNLRIVLSMDPTNPLYRERCEANPALFTRCAILWAENWSRAGLEALPAAQLHDMIGQGGDDGSQQLIQNLMAIYESMIPRGATPRHYCTQVEMYKRIFNKKREELVQQQSFLKSGLSKLAEAEATVDTLSKEANVQQKELSHKEAEANQAMQHITVSIGDASERRKEVEELQRRLAVEEGQLQEQKGGIETELTEVQPMLDAARKAVGNIKSDNINEIRSLKMPPDAIRDVLEGVLRILGQQDMSWANMRKFLGSRAVKDEIVNFDAHKITPAIRKEVDKLLSAKGNSFEHAVIYRVSVAAAPMAAWVKANIRFSIVLEKIAPLERAMAGLNASLESSKQRLVECEAELGVLDQKVVELKEDFTRKTGEAESLKIGLKRAQDTLGAAENLLGKLAGEKGRWVETVAALDAQIGELPLYSMMASAFAAYLPGHPEDVRAEVQAGWAMLLQVPPTYDFKRFMSSESEMLTWKAEGLPGDDLSMENGISILETSLSPLIIDPSTSASEWLKTHLTKSSSSSSSVEVATMHDPRFANTLELAVRFGKTLVVSDVDEVEALLYPLLRRDLVHSGPRYAVQLGDKLVDYNEAFRLYLITRNPAITIPPDAAPLLAVTNFTVTRSGMESQLLGLTIKREQPELEHQKSALLKQEEELKVELAALERSLLQSLATSKGNLLENKELLDSLNETKAKSNTITTSLDESHRLQITLDEQRNAYAPIAQRGSTMYFLVRDLAAINHMYQVSLAVFLQIFRRALEWEDHSTDVSSRLAMLNATLVKLVYGYVSRSLFNADRLTLGMHMAHHLAPDQFREGEWDLYVGKLVANEAAAASAAGSKPAWVPEACSAGYAQLVTAFPGMASECQFESGQVWSPWLLGAEAEREMPSAAAGRLSPFQALLVVQAFRPDRLQSAMSTFVCSVLGMKSVAPEPFSLKSLQEGEMRPDEPVLFIASPGADPSQELSDFAERTVGRNRYHEVAMGQGQGAVAVELLRSCARSGDWLCLKNLHLVVSWLPTLEKEIYTLTANPEFRLFLTSEPHNKFPASLLEHCLKVTFEAPPGMKKNLIRTYEFWTPEYIAEGTPVRAQLLFALAWFHAVVQERRNYIPQGWSKFYEFSFADLRSGADIINIGTQAGKSPQWEYLHGLLENAIYGGRVDNPFDLRVLVTYLEQYFTSDVVAVGGRVKPLPGTRNTVLPSSAHHGDYLALIQSLPDADTPALFSLPPNIDRAAQQANSAAVVAQLKAMAVASSAAMGFQRQQWSRQLGPILKLWEQLMGSHPGLRAPGRAPGGTESWGPVESFVALERSNAARLVSTIDGTLTRLSRVLRGADALSPAVQSAGAALMLDEVPSAWDALWEGPEAPLDYCRAVVSRAAAIESWLGKASSGQLLPPGGQGPPLDLSHLLNPVTFLNALRQTSARQLGTSVDNLKLVSCWEGGRLRSPVAAPIAGMLIQGATFDGVRLSATSGDAPTDATIPPATFAWIPKTEAHPYSNFATVPLYVTSDRSKLLAEVQMPVVSAEEQVQWTLAGVALFLCA